MSDFHALAPVAYRSGPPVPALLVCGVSENDARKLFDAALPVVNNALGEI